MNNKIFGRFYTFPFKCLSLIFLISTYSNAVTVYYFPANFDGNTQRPQEISSVGNFPALCSGGNDSAVRLPGLDFTRLYAGVASCPATNGSGRLNQIPDYIFLIDDTRTLSPYLMQQFGAQNLLNTESGTSSVRPRVLQFEGDEARPGIKILVVGERAYSQVASSQAWLSQLNSGFSDEAILAGGDREIFLAYHGSFFDSNMRHIPNPSAEKINEYFAKQGQATTTASSSSSSSGATPTPGPTPAPAPAGTNAYIQQCRSASVPIPPVWNPTTGTNQWTKRGPLATPYSSTSSLPKVEVWTYASSSPAGLCIALPRMNTNSNGSFSVNSNVELLGIICQSETTGKACFWDNVDSRTNNRVTGTNTRDLSVARLKDGSNLRENCTNCHRGSNVFLTQRYTHLDVNRQCTPRLDTSPQARYTPVSSQARRSTWINPTSRTQTALQGVSSGQCMMCHGSSNEIPELTLQYCSTVMDKIVGRNMPPSAVPSSERANCSATTGGYGSGSLRAINLPSLIASGGSLNSYRDHIVKIADLCCAKTRGRGLPNLRRVASSSSQCRSSP